jgi:hypothetical protein
MKFLLTLFHVSDLHIGGIEPSTGDNPLSDADIRWWMHFPPFDGYLGHTAIALEQVKDLFHDTIDKDGEDNVRIVVTGDLTTTGSDPHLANADTYLSGLSLAPVATPLQIAGNHDHWPGRPCTWWRSLTCMLGGPSGTFNRWFPNRPLRPSFFPLANGWTLRIDGLDSEEDVGGTSAERVCAIGNFHDQCGKLANILPRERPGNEIRVLLVHHSSIHDQIAGTSTMTTHSRDLLADLVRSREIAMVLTGHTHLHALRQPGENSDIREARCGTSTSRDYFNRHHGVSAQMAARLKRNEVLIHRLFDDRSAIVWQTEVWRRTGAGRAAPFSNLRTFDFGAVAR